jgi:hypothetical protein
MEPHMSRSTLVVAALVLVLGGFQTLTAQVPNPPSGTRVRVTAPDVSPKPLVGVVNSVSRDTIRLRTRGDVMISIPWSQVTHLESSRGRKRPMWSKTAPLWLTASVGGAGALVGYAASSDDDFFGRGFGAAIAGGLGGALGLLVGTGLAIGVRQDRWIPVVDASRDSRVIGTPSLYVSPGSRGPILGIRATF